MPEIGGIIEFVKEYGLGPGFMLLLYLGFFESRRSVNRLTRILEERVNDALDREHHYRQVSEKLQATVDLQAHQLGELLEQAKLTAAALQSIEIASRQPPALSEGRHRRNG